MQSFRNRVLLFSLFLAWTPAAAQAANAPDMARGASAMVVLIMAHMLRVFAWGAYKYPREINWALGVLLFLVVMAFSFTGYLLPWDQKGYWATAVGTKIYAIGGAKNPSYSTPELRPTVPVENVATNEVYDTTTNTWSSARPMLTARNHQGAALIDGKIYVVGGRVGSTFIIGLSTNVSTNEVYDVAKDTWSSVLGVPTARSGVGVAVLNGRMHVLGGEAYLNDLVGTYRTHEAYDPRTNTWERLPPMPTPRHGLAVAEIGGRIYAVSGSNVAGGGGPHEGVNVNEVYDPK